LSLATFLKKGLKTERPGQAGLAFHRDPLHEFKACFEKSVFLVGAEVMRLEIPRKTGDAIDEPRDLGSYNFKTRSLS
jgi:hypothetical protein